MGNSGSRHWQQEYTIVETITPNHLRVSQKANSNNLFEIFSLYVPTEQQEELMRRVRQRERDRNIHLQKLMHCSQDDDQGLCGNTQRFSLVYRECSPTLADHWRSRSTRRLPFSSDQICHVIRSVALALAYLKGIRQTHGSVDLGSIIVNREVYLSDPILVEHKSQSRGYRKTVNGFPSPQKLRQNYDVLVNLDQQTSDLFSLGVTALQLHYLDRDLHQIYQTKTNSYSNTTINYHLLTQLASTITEGRLQQWIWTLLSPDQRSRLKIYDLFNNYQVDIKKLRILKEHPFKIKPEELLAQQINPYIEPEQSHNNPRVMPVLSPPLIRSQSINFPSSNRPSVVLPITHQYSNKIQSKPFLSYESPLFLSNMTHTAVETRPWSQANQQYRSSFNSYPLKESNYEFKAMNGPVSVVPKIAESLYIPAPTTASISSFALPAYKSQEIRSNYLLENESHFNSPEIDINTDLKELSQSLQRLSSNLKSFIDSQSQQLSKKRENQIIYDVNSSLQMNYPPLTTASALQEQSQITPKRMQFRKASSLYVDKIVPVIPQVQEEHSNLTDSEYVIEEYEIGTKYQGCKRNGKRNGTGKFYYSQGSCYDGEWKDNKMHGYGVLTYPNGSIAYEGQWKDDEFEGKGIIYNDDPQPISGMLNFANLTEVERLWITYQGQMKNGKRNGEGKLSFINGQYFQGEFKEDEITGHGEFYCLNGRKITGRWQNGIMVGYQ